MKFERYVKKPVSVEVIQYKGEIIDCLKNDLRISWEDYESEEDTITIVLPDDGMSICRKGDYIIRGDQGELITCDAASFELNYEKPPQRKKRTSKNTDVVSIEVDDVFENEAD
jgi:hypothetical protein